jgi:hypothetical protein
VHAFMMTAESDFMDDLPTLSEAVIVLVTSGKKRWLNRSYRDGFWEQASSILLKNGSKVIDVSGGAEFLVIKLEPSKTFSQESAIKALRDGLSRFFYSRWPRKANNEYEGGCCWSEVSFYFESFDFPLDSVKAYVRMSQQIDETAPRKASFEVPIQY